MIAPQNFRLLVALFLVLAIAGCTKPPGRRGVVTGPLSMEDESEAHALYVELVARSSAGEWAAARATVQLLVVGALFTAIFNSDLADLWAWAWVVAMVVMSGFVVRKRAPAVPSILLTGIAARCSLRAPRLSSSLRACSSSRSVSATMPRCRPPSRKKWVLL